MNTPTLEASLSHMLAEWFRRQGYGQPAVAALERTIHEEQAGPPALRDADLNVLRRLTRIAIIPIDRPTDKGEQTL